MVNDPEVLPCGTTTVAGTVAEELVLASVTEMPPAGAAAPIVTVPVEIPPPETVVGLSTRDMIAGGLMVSVALRTMPFRPTEI